MKTAISVPDATFEAATKKATELGMSRSEFFARAAERYLRQLDAESLTAQINAAIDRVGQDEQTQALVTAAGRRRLSDSDDEW